MTQLEFNKTWSERAVNPIAHFFENYFHYLYDGVENDAIHNYSDYFDDWNNKGKKSYRLSDYYYKFPINNNLKAVLLSKESLDELDMLNVHGFNDTDSTINPEYFYGLDNSIIDPNIPPASNSDSLINRYDKFFDHLFMGSDAAVKQINQFIQTNVSGKEGSFMERMDLDFNECEFINDIANNRFTFKYNKSIKLQNHFDMNTYTANGNTDLYLLLPYRALDGGTMINVWNPTTALTRPQFSYLALKITDLSGDGDIKFDHTDKIDYIDNIEVTFVTPNSI